MRKRRSERRSEQQTKRVIKSVGAGISRRRFIGSAVAVYADLLITPESVAKTRKPESAALEYWWHRYPSLIQTEDPELFRKSAARMVIHGCAKDPTWGPFGQLTSRIESAASLSSIKKQGGRAITWIEGFGDCMMYVAAFNRLDDGAMESRLEDTLLARVERSHWNWADPKARPGNAIRWVGFHNLVDDEDFCHELNKRNGLLFNPPEYPNGKPALGTIPGRIYPLNHRVYDACGSKNLNGELYANFEAPANVNTRDPATGKPKGPIEGLYPAILGKDDVASPPGMKNGDVVYCGVISVHKDLSAPIWREYVRRSVHEIVHAGLDGVWCDNYSPWDNFGYPPLQKAFGDWSVARFHQQYSKHNPEAIVIGDPSKFNIIEHLKTKAIEFGAKNSSDLNDPAWRDKRWLEDEGWNEYKCFRQSAAQHDLKEFYDAIHEETSRIGRPDFCIGGNDVPLYGLGWVRDTWQDMINTETTPGWHMGAGSRGIMIPPLGKMAIMYRAALEHQKGPFSAAWYYLNGGYEKHQGKPEIGKLLCTEAFANGAFLLCMPDNKQVCGTLESHTWWNRFVSDKETWFGRREPFAEVGVLFSPDNQLAEMAPGGYPDIDFQPHIFGHHGWATACIDAHYPYRAITDWKLTRELLAPLKILVLPHALALSDRAIDAICKWTEAGGRLVLTGDAGSLYDPKYNFNPRGPDNKLTKKLGVSLRWPRLTGVIQKPGKGSVAWIEDNPGSDYYLQHTKRVVLLPVMVKQLGYNSLIRSGSLPSTVGLSLWRASDHKSLFVDLVNYDLDADRDLVTPAQNISFSVRVPTDWVSPQIEAISPDAPAAARIESEKGWATVSLSELHHFVSLKLFS